jgi:hypothetical protein
MSIDRALSAWRELIGDDVRQDEETIGQFGRDTSPAVQRIAAVLRPTSRDQVRGIVQVAVRSAFQSTR